ncbi:hypothetical protein BXZ70DRAFT_917827 [Cristinia sonorae]|uniref:Beta-glucuronidase C-terminal domain-containing protein n=1 Tax=Cristinia sonorae TaxID=1940300 RepID=A0A8K0UYC0_9AGAR|nr:hypothetical protein BXZ70DRAFT_917827 [Cristinia sonorae]
MLVRHPCGVLPSLFLLASSAFAAVPVPIPATNPSPDLTTVYSNFFGISIELSFANYYFGNDSNTVPQPVVEYLSALRERGSGKPVRLRLGGNSMDSSTYVPDQPDIIEFTDPNANSNDQPVNYGEKMFEAMNALSDKVGGAEYLIGLSLRNPNNTNIPLLAGDAQHFLGDKLDAFLLGNEPDLYTAHGQRPNIKNYTEFDYIGEYWEVFAALSKTPQGDVLSLDKIAGPTICCFWDLAPLLVPGGWLDQFNERLKYITLQHYPQNNCFGSYQYEIDYYLHHANAVGLAKWQDSGLDIIRKQPAETRKPVIMDEFNSASCGGIPGISDTFAATLWGADYGLQLAAVGYSAAYLHTREVGVTYNLFDPPPTVAAGSGPWTTNPSFYTYLPVSEALQGNNGSKVVDLNIQNSATDKSQSVAGYGIYDASSNSIHHLVLFNFDNATTGPVEFTLPSELFTSTDSNVAVRFLTAPHVNEKHDIAWGNLTWSGVGDGKPVTASGSWVQNDQTIACAQGCTVSVPGPALAVVYVGGFDAPSAPANTSTTKPGGSNNTQDSDASVGVHAVGLGVLLSAAAVGFSLVI